METLDTRYQFTRFHFQGQHENEQVLRVVHRHWFNILAHLGIIIVLAILVSIGLMLVPALFPSFISPGMSLFFSFVQNTMLLMLWILGFLIWIDYYFDVWIITNERIINIEQKGLFTRDISELRYESVQDVTSSVVGLIPTMLNFGDVSVQTAAKEERFLFRQVGDPFTIKDQIMALSRDAMKDDIRDIAETLRK